MRTISNLMMICFFGGVWCFPPQVMAAEEQDVVTVSCMPQQREGRGVLLKSGQSVLFDCSVANPSLEQRSVMIIGKQLSVSTNDTIATSAQVVVTSGAAADVTLHFPELYTPGVYRYEFSVVNLDSKETMNVPVQWSGELEQVASGETVVSVIAERGQYVWGETAMIKVEVSQWQKEGSLMLVFALEDEAGGVCQELNAVPLAETQATYAVTLPNGGTSCSNAVKVSLVHDGITLDQKTIALGLSQKEISKTSAGVSFTESLPKFILWLGGVLVIGTVIIIGLRLVRKQ